MRGVHVQHEVDVIDVQTAGEDRERATSFVTFRWYDMRTMLLAETTVKQEWRRTINGYWLISESVTDGNARLLEVPERLRLVVESAVPLFERLVEFAIS